MKNSPTIGDKLTRPKAVGIIKHVGVLIGHNTVLTNTPARGEHACTVDEFSAGQAVEVERTGANRFDVLFRSQEVLANPKPYNPLLNNCEHTVGKVLCGKAESLQVRVTAALVVLGLILCSGR